MLLMSKVLRSQSRSFTYCSSHEVMMLPRSSGIHPNEWLCSQRDTFPETPSEVPLEKPDNLSS